MWIKICGVKEVETALWIAQLPVDAIGLNFYAKSVRCVDVETAAEIVDRLPTHVTPVGLFVNHSLRQIREIVQVVGLKTIQLHGDEPLTLLEELSDLRVIRALRIPREQPQRLPEYHAELKDLKVRPWATLVDADVTGHYGGSGQTLDWRALKLSDAGEQTPPVILAGGLTLDNVGQAIELVQPWGVDVASGVEAERGVKDLPMCRRFVEKVRGVS